MLVQKTSLRMTGWVMHVVGAAVLVGGIAAYQLLVSATITHKKRQHATEVDRLERLVADQPKAERILVQLNSRLAELRRRAQATREGIPHEPRESEFLRQLTDVADQEQLKIRDYQTGVVTKLSNYSQLDIRLIAEGDYASICGFLERISQLSRVKTVQRMQITGLEGRNVYPLEISLTLYFAADNTPAKG